jgi:hypothetical protein
MNRIAMPSGLRKIALTTHVGVSVGLLGAIASFLALAIAGLTQTNGEIGRAAYPAMALTAQFVIVPLALAALFGGILQALGTRWGLFRHYWVLAKLVLTVFANAVLLVKMPMIGYAARHAAEAAAANADLAVARLQLAAHAGAGLLVLLVPVVLSIYKPAGTTPFRGRT